MSNNEAKFLLNGYRPSGLDAADPVFKPALDQAKSDPALGAWFAHQQAHDAAVAGKLREIAPPPGLRDAILAGGRATEKATATPLRHRVFASLGLAAALAVLVAVTARIWLRSTATPDTLTAFALDDIVHGRHNGHGPAVDAMAARLASPNLRLTELAGLDLTALQAGGCRTLSVGGHPVLEICFLRQGTEYHCYIGRAQDFPQLAEHEGHPKMSTEAKLAAAAWSKAGYAFVVATDAGASAVRRLL